MRSEAYVVLGPLAAAVTGFVGAAPLLIETVVGVDARNHPHPCSQTERIAAWIS